MPSLLRRTIGALKDQTSISLARLASSDLEVAVLKTTSHEEVPVEERHLTEVVLLCSSSQPAAAACVRALSRRISRTHNWVVALKALVLASRLLREGGPYFRHEAVAPRRRLLDLSSFRDGRSPSPWDFTAFVRTFALYLDACLDAALLGKLDVAALLRRRPSPSAGGKLPAVLDRVALWQRLLGRAISTRPTGLAKSSRLVHVALYPVVRETFDLYRGVSEGLSLLVNNFFHLQHATCVETFNACVTASKQFDELESFYRLCRKIGVGRTSEYPSVQKISSALLKSLEGFSGNCQQASVRSHLIDPWRKSLDVDQASDTARNHHRPSAREKDTAGDRGSEFSDETCSVAMHARSSSGSSNASSMSNNEKWITKDLVAVHVANDSRLQDWELALIANVDEAFINHANAYGNDPVQEPHDHQLTPQPDGKNLPTIDQKPSYCDAPQSLHNPFLPVEQTSLSIVPWSSTTTAAPVPTFRADVGPSEDSPAEATTPDASSRQQQVLDEQRLWMQQQSKILAKNLGA